MTTKCDRCISCFIFHLSFCTIVIGQLAVIRQASKQTLKLFFTRIRHLSIGKHVRKKAQKNKNEKKKMTNYQIEQTRIDLPEAYL